MPVFRCDSCGCVENTAVCHYWTRDRTKPPLCSECDPEIGKWHKMFAKEKRPELVELGDGFLYAPEEVVAYQQRSCITGKTPNCNCHPCMAKAIRSKKKT